MSGPAPTLQDVSDDDLATEALAVLRRLVGRDDADFHDGQLEAIAALVGDRQRALVVQRTGWGKSAVYFVATALLRARRAPGPTVHRLPAAGADARPDRRGRAGRHPRGHDQLGQRRGVGRGARGARRRRRRRAAGQPGAAEQPALPRAPAARPRRTLRAARGRRGALHQRLGPRLPSRLPAHPRPARHAAAPTSRCWRPPRRPTPGWSPTSSSSSGCGGHEVLTVRGSLARDSLRLGVLRAALRGDAARPGWSRTSADFAGSGIIYTLTVCAGRGPRGRCCATARARRSPPTPAAPSPPSARSSRTRCARNEVKALVATSALGMGFDKPDLGFVVHLGRARVAGRLLPAGRPRRSRGRDAPTCCCCPRRPTATSGTTSPRRRCRARPARRR